MIAEADRTPKDESNYWEGVGVTAGTAGTDNLWRAHSDSVNRALLEAWLPRKPVDCLLKTDAYDEAVSAGLFATLAGRACSVFGIDLASATLRAARKRTGWNELLCADVRCLPFPDGRFDVVVSLSTLDHFHDLPEVMAGLSELHRVMRPDGELLLTMDNLANPAVALRNALPFGLLYRLGLVPYFTGATCGVRGLRRLLREAGFEVQEARHVMHCPRVLAVAATRLVQEYGGPSAARRCMRVLSCFEWLSVGPLRYVTGYFVAIKAIRK